jgi:hypothetical protein
MLVDAALAYFGTLWYFPEGAFMLLLTGIQF